MFHHQPLQANRELDITAAHHVLHLKACEPGLNGGGGGGGGEGVNEKHNLTEINVAEVNNPERTIYEVSRFCTCNFYCYSCVQYIH